MNEPTYAQERGYDYKRQAWLERVSASLWRVLECAHPQPLATCYACQYAGKLVTDNGEIR
jgi:hypothetical protein